MFCDLQKMWWCLLQLSKVYQVNICFERQPLTCLKNCTQKTSTFLIFIKRANDTIPACCGLLVGLFISVRGCVALWDETNYFDRCSKFLYLRLTLGLPAVTWYCGCWHFHSHTHLTHTVADSAKLTSVLSCHFLLFFIVSRLVTFDVLWTTIFIFSQNVL